MWSAPQRHRRRRPDTSARLAAGVAFGEAPGRLERSWSPSGPSGEEPAAPLANSLGVHLELRRRLDRPVPLKQQSDHLAAAHRTLAPRSDAGF